MTFSSSEHPLPLPARFALIKKKLISGREDAVILSWERLLSQLKSEIETISKAGPDIIPSIDFGEIERIGNGNGRSTARVKEFSAQLQKHGVAVIRGVIPKETTKAWSNETRSYLSGCPDMGTPPALDPHLRQVYWSPAQVKARASPRILAAQKFLMNYVWRAKARADAPVTTNFPVVYADRLRIRESGSHHQGGFSHSAHIDGGSVERWEPDGYGASATYQKVWDGDWENYDPWDSSTRLRVTSDLYNCSGSCSMFRMFQGWLSLGTLPRNEGSLLLCPMIQLTTAYLLLRPFFSPVHSSTSHPNFLSPDNWRLEIPASSFIQGAVPSYTQELNSALHPHLQLNRSMVRAPPLDPGDYLVWHCDTVYAINYIGSSNVEVDATVLYVPACPLTQTNALYLARQRKAFLLGQPSPDFGGGGSGTRGESTHLARPGVQDISDAGGDEGLRAMGLLPWDDDDAETDVEAELLEMANNMLFPDRYEFDLAY